MASSLLPDHLSPLVDKLRAGDHQSVSLPDMAALTEILMRSMDSYFNSIDLTIFQECQELADYIEDARSEISSLSPEHSDEAGIPRAGLELEAIVQQTESATNTIMTSAEKIMEADSNDMEAYTAVVNDSVMQIFEACSFQDITGQRISKVVSTLAHVEDRVSRLVNILGVMDGAGKSTPKEEISEDDALLSGPALDGEGIDQSEIDDLLNGQINDEDNGENENQEKACEEEDSPEKENSPEKEDITSDAAPEPAEDEEKAAKDEPNLIEQAKLKKAEMQAEKKTKAEPAKPVAYEEDADAALDAKPSETTSQSDIDALFA